jgi:hypothetical protein
MSHGATGENPEENALLRERAAQGAAASAENGPIDSDLQMLIDAWPAMPESAKAIVLAVVAAVAKK